MVRGDELWDEGRSVGLPGKTVLLLNPRLPAAWRERVLQADFPDLRDHVWVATSGTGGVLKLVALSRQALESSAAAVNAHLSSSPADIWLNPLPRFHVGGLGIAVRAALAGAKFEDFAPWDAERFVRTLEQAGTTLTSLVPAQVRDLVAGGWSAPPSLRAAVVGGGELSAGVAQQARDLGWPLCPSYGLTEAASQVATAALNASSTDWWPVLPHLEVRVDDTGVLEIRGGSLLTGWMIFPEDAPAIWEDPKRDGWFRTQDRVALRGPALRVLGRIDDLVKIRGELVDCAALERRLQERVPSGLVALRHEPDERNGHSLHITAEHATAATEAAQALDIFPPYARPASIKTAPLPRNALGKIVRSQPDR